MDNFLMRPKEELEVIFKEASERTGLTLNIIEKDFWVCWILKQLYSIPEYENKIIFKGGTSLSKAYKLIDRFSEDVDLTLDKSILKVTKDPSEKNISNKEQSKRVDTLIKIAQDYISEKFLPLLSNQIKKQMNDRFEYKLVVDNDKQTILFYYPQLSNALHDTSYIKPIIRLEFGVRGGITPKENQIIQPYIADVFPDFFEQRNCLIPTLSAERTFWEKLIILHSLYHKYLKGKHIGHRSSRHYYDIYMMCKKGIIKTALLQKHLLKEVIINNMIFFKNPSASYETAQLNKLKLTPTQKMLTELEQDYKEMEVMMMGNYPNFNKIISKIKTLEHQLNSFI
jgi:hypothetical protein